jgi:hypothetical protein
MPGLRLTAPQIERLCGIDQAICQAVLDALVDASFLRVLGDGTYTRLTDGSVPRARPAGVGHPQPREEHRKNIA